MTLKFAIRNLKKRPFLNLIKVIGLSLALSGILLIVLFLKNELTFDRFYKNSERIYRFTVIDPSFIAGRHFARVFNPGYVLAMADYFPEVENYVRLAPVRGGVMKYNEQYIVINQAFECDSTFFEVFDVKLLVGDPENILNSPGSMVVSESFARKIFGNANPSGQILTLPSGQFYGRNTDFTVKGVMEDFPQNSHFHPEFITTPIDRTILEGWAWTYLLLYENADPGKIISGFKNFYSSLTEINTDEIKAEAYLQKVTDIHLHSNKLREIEPNSSMSVIYTLSIASLILLMIALANYANLNIGMTYYSDKYLFISKISGSSVWMTLRYFMTEGIIIFIVSVAISIIISASASTLILKHLGSDLFAGNTVLVLITVVLFALLSLLSGILPIIKQGISSIRISSDRRIENKTGRKGLSKSIIVLQYAISIALIVAVIVIRRQNSYAMEMSMGAGNKNLICFKDVHTNVQSKFEVFKKELLKYNSIEYVSAMFAAPGDEANDLFQYRMEGHPVNETNRADNLIGIFPCDYSFTSIFNLKFLGGENFSERNEDNEGSGEYIINESAMKRLNYHDPAEITGKEFKLITNIEGIEIPAGKIIGVVEDFHLSGIKKKTEPLVMFKRKDLWLINFVVSFRPGMRAKAISDIESVWTKIFPGYPFQYEYVSSMYEKVYNTERLQAKLLSIFTIMALFICSMGLLGLSLLTTQRRTKEIGLRRINGAGINKLMLLLNRDLIKWIIISFVIAIPFSYYAMDRWLESFAYKISLNWWIFALAGLTAVLIALLTISVQSWKAASRNPVDALRYE
jgi:putative ABC transport system permease protein